ncbi:MAG: D-alanyl-D-alanine carboxypeptidase [Candidatus Methylomirabilis oxygeniifera]|uniref:Putative Serine-type D-Ala-D-Ala carboxypeptidase n=1 Tax=Methylomirabilis oxygeniifera TaxID=671143 RepID=D5MHP6_METO1|nr:MAG: D-alanyl-D-alanine carboxypeptidase [Candidatus Methylomirabilis oxyfera]CBE67179.1 putative Serine-type D-Ala-D-Ala carboxypeptidase [Candidatus Methylomirabilis oxyfera]
MKSGKTWIALVTLSALLATAMPALARSPRPARSREDLTLPSTSRLSVQDTQANRAQIDRPLDVPVSTRQTARWGVPSDLNWFVNDPEALSASSALLMDADTGAILFARHHMERRSPASTTKIMTALLILEEGQLDDKVLISERAAAVSGTGLGLRRGQRVVLRDLLWAILLKSANDAALAAAEHVGGSEEQFVARMNAKAASLGMQGTQFSNPHGLDHQDHYSTAFDLAILARQALRNPTFARMVQTREAQVAILTGRNGSVVKRRVIRTHNQLLGQFSGADGVKTGYTSLAGRCLVASATRGDHQLIAVLLNDSRRWVEAAALLEYGFAALGGRVSSVGVSNGGSVDMLKGEGG